MDLGLKSKIALINAASQGLGLAVAHAFAREGAKIAITARDQPTLERRAAEIREQSGAAVLAIACDLTQPASIASMVETVVAHYGTVHVLVNNAGGPPPGTVDSVSDANWQSAFDLTLMSAVRTTRAVLPHMRRQRWGRIVNVSSFSAKQPIPDIALSNSLRLGVAGWAKSLANEVAGENVLINTVGPGWTRTSRVTQMLASRAAAHRQTTEEAEKAITRGVPIGRLAEPDEIADVIVFLASERASYVTGTFLPVDGGVVQSPT